MRRRIAIAVLAAGLLASGARAQPLDWTVEAGAAARVRPAHIGSDRYLIDAAPIFEATLGDDITISFDDGVKWRAVKLGSLSAGPIAEYRQSFNDQLPRGAFRMSDAVELGAFTEWRTPIGVAEARLRRAVNGYQGWSGDLSFSTGAPVTPKLSLGGQARLSWADAAFTEEYFGLKPHTASRLGLPRFLDENFLTVGGEFDAARQVTNRTRLVLALSADRMIGEMQPSPLFTTRNIFTASLGLTYRWSAKPMGRAP
jgi:outer membrane scaffolding protein for murein synthesis (MipA/OmpV family)